MTWDDVFTLILAAVYGATGMLLFLANRRMKKAVHDLIEAGNETFGGLSRVIHCLAYRLSEQGWVEISEEEWETSERGEVHVMHEEDGVRVLAK